MKNRRENQAIPRKKSLFRRICSRGMLLVGMLMCVNFWSYASGQAKTVSLNVKDKALKEVLAKSLDKKSQDKLIDESIKTISNL